MANIDVVKMICRKLEKPESLITYVGDRKGHDLRYAVDTAKIKNELGWQPAIGLGEGMRKTIEWYRERKR